jgi:LemA protein
MPWLILSLLTALVIFWAVGAYNRLTRLRAEVLRQWGTVDTIWLKWLMRLQGSLTARQILAWSSEADDLQALQDACESVVEALADARQQGLSPSVLETLLERHEVLMQCIDEVAQRLPDTLRPRLLAAQSRILQNIPPALMPYHVAAEHYNTALAQAPARWLARRLRLRPAVVFRLPSRNAGVLA